MLNALRKQPPWNVSAHPLYIICAGEFIGDWWLLHEGLHRQDQSKREGPGVSDL